MAPVIGMVYSLSLSLPANTVIGEKAIGVDTPKRAISLVHQLPDILKPL